MTLLQLMPVLLSCLVLAAHFFRAGDVGFVVALLALMVLLSVRRAWVARLVQAVLLLGTVEWLRTLFALTSLRRGFGEPYARLVIILGAVAALTAASTLVFRAPRLRRRYRLAVD